MKRLNLARFLARLPQQLQPKPNPIGHFQPPPALSQQERQQAASDLRQWAVGASDPEEQARLNALTRWHERKAKQAPPIESAAVPLSAEPR
jgi:hypothetical protein